MLPIELYHLPWSHYVEKVRWALDFKEIQWCGIEVNAFTKRQIRRFDKGLYVPLIYDPNTQVAISDSTSILRYLDETYPHKPLFPPSPDRRADVIRWTTMLDSFLGLGARRLGYTQLILESPRLLNKLFLQRILGGLLTWPGISYLATVTVAAVLIIRFRLHRNREDGIYEALELFLLEVADRLRDRKYLIGETVTAADIALAALLRPLRIVPFFFDHAGLQGLFRWQASMLEAHGREPTLIYEEFIAAVRQRRGYVRGRITWLRSDAEQTKKRHRPIPAALESALNDQRPVYDWRLLLLPVLYAKVRWFSGVEKQSLPSRR